MKANICWTFFGSNKVGMNFHFIKTYELMIFTGLKLLKQVNETNIESSKSFTTLLLSPAVAPVCTPPRWGGRDGNFKFWLTRVDCFGLRNVLLYQTTNLHYFDGIFWKNPVEIRSRGPAKIWAREWKATAQGGHQRQCVRRSVFCKLESK